MNFVLAEFITKLVLTSILLSASAIMSRRSTRLYVEDGDEMEPAPATTTTEPKVVETAMTPLVDMERTVSASSHTSTATNTSSSSSLSSEGSAAVDVHRVFANNLSHGLDHDLRFHAAPSGLHRPHNFGLVLPGVYRSSYPKAEDYEFIQGLKLKTIV